MIEPTRRIEHLVRRRGRTGRSTSASSAFGHDALDHRRREDVDDRRAERPEHAGQRHVALRILDRVGVLRGRLHAEECPQRERDARAHAGAECSVPADSRPPRRSSALEPEPADHGQARDRDDDAPDRDRADACPSAIGPPKLATVVSQIRPMTPMHVAIGVEDSHGKNVAR